MCVSRCEFMGGRTHEMDPTQDSKSGSFFDNDTIEEKSFDCKSCPRKFPSQQALAGHRNIHRGEWESLLDMPNQVTKPINPPTFASVHLLTLVKPPNTLIGPSTQYHLANLTNTLNGQLATRSLASHNNTLMKEPSSRYQLANPTKTLKGPFTNGINTLLGSSFIAPQSNIFGPIKTPCMSLVREANHPHGKLALGVRYESMIQKPFQCRCVGQSDMLLRARGSPLFGMKQMMGGGNIRRFGTNKSHVDTISFLTTAGSGSSSFQPRDAHDDGVARWSHALVPQPDHNGENVDVDLELKL